MGNDQQYIYGEYAMLKLIADPDGVRLKLCPKNGDGTWDEVEGTLEITLDRFKANMLVRFTRNLRDAVFGKDE
jgi:hypothetical protein